MAKSTDQMELMDVDDPKIKPIKKEIIEYEAMLDENRLQHAADREAEQKKRSKILEKLEAANIKPERDGVYRIPVDDYIWEISQEAQLKINRKKRPKEEAANKKTD